MVRKADFGVILQAVTLDGWVVIGILLVMLVVALWIMVVKAIVCESRGRGQPSVHAQVP